MDYTSYLAIFDQILGSEHPDPPYDKPNYLHYTRLNQSRMKRWELVMEIDPELAEEIRQIRVPEKWILITEPWCGDAAHSVPFLVRMAVMSPLIELEIQLRDSPPFLIESYLSGKSRSIPKLIVRDDHDRDLWTWGPRPKGAQDLMDSLKSRNVELETLLGELQQWYNQDKGRSLCQEIKNLRRSLGQQNA